MNTDAARPGPPSDEPARPETAEESTTRIPLTPPPPHEPAADPEPREPSVEADAPPTAPRPTAPRPAAAGRTEPANPAAAPAPAAADAPSARPSPRTGPIVWGALILVFCGYVSQQVLGGGGLDAAGWITATVIGLGVLLLGVGFAVLIRSRRETRRRQ
ncbi:hypothetical protein ACWGOE_00555 [Leucobacter chromiiresistens]